MAGLDLWVDLDAASKTGLEREGMVGRWSIRDGALDLSIGVGLCKEG